ncbi:MAG: HNH endonuclease [Clostridiales bacterium]|nr:HNH endonuclease [Clostridiales bacterium]
MKATKLELLRRNGTKCMLCGKDVGKRIQWHHLVPKYAGGDDSYANGSLLCPNCHTEVHEYSYGDEEYTNFTQQIIKNKQ